MPNLPGLTDTVIDEYIARQRTSQDYQSEAELERALIDMLCAQGYVYADIKTEAELEANLRAQLEALNSYKFTDNEWQNFFSQKLANTNEGVAQKTKKLQQDGHIQDLTRDDGTTRNITILDKANLRNNRLQVINQFVEEGGAHAARYDVTLLVNGLPLVHIELKRRGVALKEAFNQINRYKRDSFWGGSGLFEYVQVFVISNGTHTKYYSNTTRAGHIRQLAAVKKPGAKASDSFEFTTYWSDAKNNIISDLTDFAQTFLAPNTILNVLTKYCVFTTAEQLLVMRPYQIAAAERIINRIGHTAHCDKLGTVDAGGYIWHTTGSGKTLTSFKTAQLATQLPYIDKVLFVVDRKDLDYQTIREYDKFAKGCANGNNNTAVLQRQLEDLDERGNPHPYDIIVTTIQKLDRFITANPNHPVRDKHVVLIFDECHRSQFGDMHSKIVGGVVKKRERSVKIDKYFNNYHIFGFTGTPIFAKNALSGGNPMLKTTAQAFGECMHSYTIINAINDGNVLPFRVDYINTVSQKDGPDAQVAAINTEEALLAPERIKNITSYVMEHFDQKTARNKFYDLNGDRAVGFNSIFAASSIDACKKYYAEFKKQLAEKHKDLTVATIFSYLPNDADPQEGLLPDESFDAAELAKTDRDFLDAAIADYNAKFKTNFSTGGASDNGFQDYYKDLSQRVKNREVDVLIVVSMFLTGFDAATLNTLWVDKNLKAHGLIQAFSRTNRILNSVKAYGNIVCFRDLEKQTDEAVALFGDANAGGTVLLKPFEDYYFGFTDQNGVAQDGYAKKIDELLRRFPLTQPIIGEQDKRDFIVLFGGILRLRNILSAFDQFAGKDMLTRADFQDYTGLYHDTYGELKSPRAEKEGILDDLVFEVELVKQVDVNIDYILMLIEKYREKNCADKEIRVSIDKAMRSSLRLRSKKALIDAFIDTVTNTTNVKADWQKFVREQKEKDLAELIADEKLKPEETKKFLNNALRDGELKTGGAELDGLMPPVSRFAKGADRDGKKHGILQKLKGFFEKYLGLAA